MEEEVRALERTVRIVEERGKGREGERLERKEGIWRKKLRKWRTE